LADVERVVRTLPGHEDAVVVRIASERWGEVPAVITTTAIELNELRAAVKAQLDAAAAPDRVIVVDEIPTLSSGKPDRVSLQRLAQ
jgi:O-succinylbenzoic acid--CoA ligase